MAKILLTGAKGYIGVTVLDHLMRSDEPSIKSLTVDVLIRDKRAAEARLKAYGDCIKPILCIGFTDIPFLADKAVNYDIIIDAGTGFVPDGAKAFDAGILPREDTSKQKEIRQVELEELAEEIMGGLVDMAERSWAGRKVMKGTVARIINLGPDEIG